MRGKAGTGCLHLLLELGSVFAPLRKTCRHLHTGRKHKTVQLSLNKYDDRALLADEIQKLGIKMKKSLDEIINISLKL